MKKWFIKSMPVIPKKDNLINVIEIVYWSRIFEQTIDDKIYSVEINRMQNFPNPDKNNFIPYDQLTFEQVCQWLNSTVNVSEIDAQLNVMMEQAINPPVIELPLPFNQNIV